MSIETQKIISEWKENFTELEKNGDIEELWNIASMMYDDVIAHPEIARELSTMFLKTIDSLDEQSCSKFLKYNLYGLEELGSLDRRIYNDVFEFADKRKIMLDIKSSPYAAYPSESSNIIQAMNEGEVSPKLFFKNLSSESLDAKLLCVAKDPSLAKDFLKADKLAKENKTTKDFAYNPKALYQLSTQLDKLPEEVVPWMFNEIGRANYWMRDELKQKALSNVVHHDVNYLAEAQKAGYELLNNEDVELVAKLYENMQNKALDDLAVKDVKKNRSTGALTSKEQELSNACETLLRGYEDKEALKVKLSKQYPLSAQAVDAGENDYVAMCVNNLEKPEKENIRSILNRLEAVEAKTYEDFAEAVDFVHRRDMCKKVCRDFDNARNDEYQKEHGSGDRLMSIDVGQLSYGMAEAGIKDKETAEKVVDMFVKLNDRPATYGSSYNAFYPNALVKLVDKPLEDWMYPVVKKAVRNNLVRADNLGNGVDLFAACKAWEINPYMPKAVAEEVGEMSLSRRMVAGSIMDKILKEEFKESRLDENSRYYNWENKYFSEYAEERNVNKDSAGKEIIPEFWKEMARAQEMSFAEAMKTYIPNTQINRRRFTSAMLEEMGVEATSESFKQAYDKLEKGGKFDEFLAAKGEDHTIVNPQLMLKAAKARQAIKEAKAQQKEAAKDATPRQRLAQKGIIPAKGKFGEGHKVQPLVNDMSNFSGYTR